MIKQDVNLKLFNTFQIPCIASSYFAFSSEDELMELAENNNDWPLKSSDDIDGVFVLGGGSNILLPDYLGRFVIHPQNKNITTSPLDREMITVGAGVDWDELVAYTVSNHLSGLECLTLIPGNVGASVVQNIGAYGAEVAETVKQVRCLNMLTREIEVLTNKDCQFNYRTSIFKQRPELLVIEVTFKLQRVPFFFRYVPSITDLPKIIYLGFKSLRADSGAAKGIRRFKPKMHFDKVRQLLAVSTLPIRLKRAMVKFIRTKTMPDPKKVANVGCFFKSPILSKNTYESLKWRLQGVGTYPHSDEEIKVSAGDLIKLVGLNGYQQGNAKIEQNRPLIIVSNGDASGSEISQFATMVQQVVLKETGIKIEPEVVIVADGNMGQVDTNNDTISLEENDTISLEEVEALFEAKSTATSHGPDDVNKEKSA